MSYITECLHCQTRFRVTQAQLDSKAGLVKCGRCKQNFNALEMLVDAQEAVNQALIAKSAKTQVPHNQAVIASTINAESDKTTRSGNQVAASDTVILQHTTNQEEDTQTYRQDDVKDDFPTDALVEDARDDAATSPQSAVAKLFYSLFVLLLLCALALQFIYFNRVALVARYPQAKPWLQALCEPLECGFSLPMSLQQLNIEDVNLQEDAEHAGVTHLQAVLSNQSLNRVQYPAIELTLTDAFDEAVIRCVLLPKEYLANNAQIAAGFAPASTQQIQLALQLAPHTSTGYRVRLVNLPSH